MNIQYSYIIYTNHILLNNIPFEKFSIRIEQEKLAKPSKFRFLGHFLPIYTQPDTPLSTHPIRPSSTHLLPILIQHQLSNICQILFRFFPPMFARFSFFLIPRPEKEGIQIKHSDPNEMNEPKKQEYSKRISHQFIIFSHFSHSIFLPFQIQSNYYYY